MNETEISRADGLSGAYRAKTYTDRHERAAQAAFRHFSLADRWGLTGVVEVKLGLAWCYVLRGDFDEAARLARQVSAIAPDLPELKQNVLDIERAGKPTAEDRFALAEFLVASGKLEDAASEFEAGLADQPDSAVARFNLGGVLRRLGRNDAAIEQLERAQRFQPEDADVAVELGLAYMAAGDRARALAAFNRALVLDPDNPEAKRQLSGLIRQLEAK